jgi:hypothetical protein
VWAVRTGGKNCYHRQFQQKPGGDGFYHKFIKNLIAEGDGRVELTDGFRGKGRQIVLGVFKVEQNLCRLCMEYI